MDTQIKELLPAINSIEGITAWVFNPTPLVGSNNAALDRAPSGLDSAGKASCKSQSYTSWDCYSRSYVGAFTVAIPPAEDRVGNNRQQAPLNPLDPDVPTQAELDQMTPSELRLWKTKKYYYYRGVGLLTKKQSQKDTYQTLILARSAHEERASPSVFQSPAPPTKEKKGAKHKKGATTRSVRAADKEPTHVDVVNPQASNAYSGTRPAGEGEPVEPPRPLENRGNTHQNPGPTTAADPVAAGGDPNPAGGGVPPPRVDPPGEQAFFSDTVPVRVFNVTSYKTAREQGQPIPYSPTYVAFTQRMSDPASTGALGSVVRGPNVRDATSYASLCKYLQKDTGTFYEMAPIIRLVSITCSLTPPNYATEIILRRFIRDFTPDRRLFHRPYIVPPRLRDVHTSAVAMPLDIFLAWTLGKMAPVTNAEGNGFQPQRMDEWWTAVPIRAEMASQRYAIPYTYSFLHSQFWNGRVNWSQGGTTADNANTQASQRNVTISCMPTTSSLFVPGPENVIFVLVDSTSQFHSTFLRLWNNVDVPVYNGTTLPDDRPPVDLIDTWDLWFSNDHLINIQDDCNAALKEINTRLSVENNTELSLSIVAEVYGALYQGIGIPTMDDAPAYDWDAQAHGAWKISQAEVLCPGSRVQCGYIPYETDNDKFHARRKMIGYSFSALTPLHRPPSGLSKLRRVRLPGHTWDSVAWLGRYPDDWCPTYNITTLDSLYRTAVYVGLVLTHEKTLLFPNSTALAGWVHMLSGAISSQTAMAFSQNNISLPVWTGYDTRFDRVLSLSTIEHILESMTQGIVRYVGITDLVESWGEWDENMITEYYGMDPFNNDDWYSYSPVPYHLLVQWINKMKFSFGTVSSTQSYFWHNDNSHLGLALLSSGGSERALSVCTIDADRYMPLVVFQQQGETYSHMVAWVDNFSFFSLKSSRIDVSANKTFLESQTFVLSPVNNGLTYTRPLEMYVVNSSYGHITPGYRETRVSDIQYPDPPSMQQLIESAKNYLLYPALSALAGYATGGPVGAAIAGGSHIAKNLVEDFAPKGSAPKLTSVINTAQSEAVRQFVPQGTTPNYTQGTPNTNMGFTNTLQTPPTQVSDIPVHQHPEEGEPASAPPDDSVDVLTPASGLVE